MISLSLGLDILLVVLLLVTIIYAVLLSRRLSALRSGKVDLEGFITRMNEASARAEASLAGIKQAATTAKAELDQPVTKAQSLRDELMFLIDRADAAGERLANAGTAATPAVAPARPASTRPASTRSASRPAAKAAPASGGGSTSPQAQDDDGADAPRSKAERDLMNALKNAR